MKRFFFFVLVLAAVACEPAAKLPEPLDDSYVPVAIQSHVDAVQPGTGLVLWSENARERNAAYGKSISLEYAYCLPCKVVVGKTDGTIRYDWSSFDNWLEDVASRNHQAVVRFRYEYPGERSVDGEPGTTAVPAYIKALADFNEVYRNDPRIAFVEVGFGHWSEYHIYGTPLRPGVNFPSAAYQKEFLTYLDGVLEIPWLISIDAADSSPVVGDPSLMALHFGLFDDSFMHKDHESGYNEQCWDSIGKSTRWETGACGGEISYYTRSDQKNFLNPAGMYGITWEQASAKYHISFMIANDAPSGQFGTAGRFREASIACGYHFVLTGLYANDNRTAAYITNTGIAPIYRDAYLAVGGVRSETSLKGLLPGESRLMYIDNVSDGHDLTIESDYILPGQTIQFDAE